MRIFFIGSYPKNCSDLDQAFVREVSENLGYECAHRGWNAILGSDTENTADHFVLSGILRYAKDTTKSIEVELHRPLDPENPNYTVTRRVPSNLNVRYRFYDNEAPWQEGLYTSPAAQEKYLWASAHAGTISASDALIAIGGNSHTQRAADLAKAIGIPVVPIGKSGGQSAVLFESERTSFADIVERNPALDFSKLEWSPETASTVLDFVKAATKRSLGKRSEPASQTAGVQGETYFLSYSRENKIDCDQFELILRRENRKVLRDEQDIPPGAKLTDRIQSLIRSSGTFVALMSNSYRGSSWCLDELKFAEATGCRVVCVLIGSQAARGDLKVNCPDGHSWDQKRLVVSDLIRNELH